MQKKFYKNVSFEKDFRFVKEALKMSIMILRFKSLSNNMNCDCAPYFNFIIELR